MNDYISHEEALEALRTVFDTEAWDCMITWELSEREKLIQAQLGRGDA